MIQPTGDPVTEQGELRETKSETSLPQKPKERKQMSKKENRLIQMEDQMEAEELQERICAMVRRIWVIPLLRKAEDFVSRIYRRGSR